MNAKRWTLEWIPGTFAVARYESDAQLPPWSLDSHVLMTVTRTHNELSIVAPEEKVPVNVTSERNFVALRVVEALEFDQIGVIAGITRALADANISILAISTFETDVILFKEDRCDDAVKALAKVADVSRL